MARKVIAACGGSVRGATIAVLGLTFKPNTDDMREAPSIALITALQDAGAKVRAYDPEGMEQARAVLENVAYAEHAYACIEGADALVIVTEWDAFRALDLERVKSLLAQADPGRPAQHLSPGGHGAAAGSPTSASAAPACRTVRGAAHERQASAARVLQPDSRADLDSEDAMDARNGDPEAQGLPADHPPVKRGRIGVLLLNLGTPDATGYWSMRRYLKEFLSDPRVIEVPRWKWWPILNLIILTVRPGRKGRDYAKIWNNERNEGPLKTITRAQAEKLGAALGDERIVVDWAMRYANPSTAEPASRSCKAQGCDRILLVPLYPQYAGGHDGHGLRRGLPRADAHALAAGGAGGAALLRRSRLHRRARRPRSAPTSPRLDFEPEALIASFHGMPQTYLESGDPYHCQCQKTSRLLRETARLAGRALAHHLPVALRQRAVAAALHHRDGGAAGASPASSAWRSSPPASPPTAWRRWRSSTWRTAPSSWPTAARGSPTSPASTTATPGMRVIEHIVRRELMGWI